MESCPCKYVRDILNVLPKDFSECPLPVCAYDAPKGTGARRYTQKYADSMKIVDMTHSGFSMNQIATSMSVSSRTVCRLENWYYDVAIGCKL